MIRWVGFDNPQPGDALTAYRGPQCIGHVALYHHRNVVRFGVGPKLVVEEHDSWQAGKERIEELFREWITDMGLLVGDEPPAAAGTPWFEDIKGKIDNRKTVDQVMSLFPFSKENRTNPGDPFIVRVLAMLPEEQAEELKAHARQRIELIRRGGLETPS